MNLCAGSSAAGILSNPPHHSHIVFPYAEDRRLVDAVGFFTSSGLRNEGSVILITTEVHRNAIMKYLRSDGNVEPLEATGQLTFSDAAELRFVCARNGDPDSTLFQDGIRTLIERARHDREGRIRDVRLFGEMASLLNDPAAQRVEELTNEIVAEYSIPILCAYSVNRTDRSPLPDSILRLHSHSITW